MSSKTAWLQTKIRTHFPFFALAVIALIVALANYAPDTFLTGWDTLHPEFNYAEYWHRIIDGVWQEHQGLGSVATQAHAGEIPKVIILMLMDIFLATNQVRYAFAFLMLILGPLGVYVFLYSGVLPTSKTKTRKLGAFAGGLLYLLNLGTLQHFYVPLEMFLIHYAVLGWVFWLGLKYLKTGSAKVLFAFGLVVFFSASQAHTATLFYAFMLNLSVFLGLFTLLELFKGRQAFFTTAKRALGILVIALLLNLFWFLPNLYFALNHGKEIQVSKIHQLFSEEAFLQNKEFGTIKDMAIVRGFLFNWGEHTGNAQFGTLLNEWHAHFAQFWVLSIGYVFFGFVVLGAIISILKRNTVALAMLGVLLSSLFFLFNVNPPLGWLFEFLQENVPLFKEAFRFPFTKFSVTLMLSYAVFVGVFLSAIGDFVFTKVRNARSQIVLTAILYSFVIFSLFTYMAPAFSGGLISPSMRVSIPDRYFELFNYLNAQQDYGRVANLPIHSFWGWVYHNWQPSTKLGYQGAGFLWFGIKQPLLDREFDRWNIINENYYREMAYAVYSEDVDLLEKTLEKYKVRWVLLDKSVLVISSDPRQLYFDEIENLLQTSSNIKPVRDFGAGLALYEYIPEEEFGLTEVKNKYYSSNSVPFKEYDDPLYNNLGTYITRNPDKPELVTTFPDLPFVGITSADEYLLPGLITSTPEKLTIQKNTVGTVGSFANAMVQFTVNKIPAAGGVTVGLTAVEPDFAHFNQQFFVSGGSANSYVSINEDLSETVTVDMTQPISIKLYEKPEDLQPQNVNYASILEACSEAEGGAAYSLERLVDGFALSARQVDACVSSSLADYAPDLTSDIAFVEFTAEGVSVEPEVCILNPQTGLCSNKTFADGTVYSRINPTRAEEYLIRFLTLGVASTNEVSVVYRNIKVGTLNLVNSAEYAPSVPVEQARGLIAADVHAIDIAKAPELSGFATEMQNSPRLCNGAINFQNSTITSHTQFTAEGYLQYESNGESLCDSFEMPFASHKTGYILEVVSRNIEGFPLRICLTNEHSKRCDLYVSLGFNKDFESKYYLVPPMNVGEGYTLNISNLVFGDSRSVNDLQYISLTPIPYDYLRGMHQDLVPEKAPLVVYNQAYEKGWTALCGFLPCNAEHVKVNNWANGWVFADENDLPATLAEIKIVFWPQLFEYFGFLVVVGTFSYLVTAIRKQKTPIE